MARKRPFDQVVGTQEIRAVAQILQRRHGLGEFVLAPAQGFPQQRAATMRGKTVKLCLGPAEQRRAQGSSKRKVILIGRDERQKRGDVLHRNLTAKLQAVGTRDRQIGGFTGPDNLVKQNRAALNKDEDIALGHRTRAILVRNLHAVIDHAPNLGGNPIG
ncbi:hypothetical protein GALL_483000 [mine drainage metagenome]|uniref:Uncharacterized protein n=1 Tax=mine drainage metagenome TaxID=410659 RepID=A0A1J5PR91_9ZZZZ